MGCGACVEACPGNLIKLVRRETLVASDAGTGGRAPEAPTADSPVRPVARMLLPRDCWGCTSCLKACPVGAIEFFLGADMGGTGATLGFSRTGTVSHWRVTRPDGTVTSIDVDGACANKY